MESVRLLLKRDFRNSISLKVFLLLIFMLLLQIWFILGSGSLKKVTQSGQMSFMAIVFSFNLFGSITALALSYDSISAERESKALDLILTSGVSKVKVVLSKCLNCFLISALFAGLYTAVIALVYFAACGDAGIVLQVFRYLLPVTAFLSIYGIMGLMLSILLRSSKQSLILSAILGGLTIPRLFVVMVDGLGSALGLGKNLIETLYMLSPALIMNALSGYEGVGRAFLGSLMLAVYVVGMLLVCIKVFIGQDELNYGE
jgi:ABC-type transport system involved in multi-copper enzyme maturation permease subunit